MKINKKSLFLIILLLGVLFLSAKSAFSTESGEEFKLRKEILKFVPYEKLNTLLTANKKLVYMPYAELKKLIKEKSRPEPPAPVDYVIKELKLRGSIKDGYIAFEGDYKIDLLNKAWAKIPVLSANTGLKQAVFDEKPARLVNENSFYSVISDEVGEHLLKLSFDVKGSKSGNNNTVNFSIPNVSISVINVDQAPGATDLSVNKANGRVEVKWKTASGKIRPIAHKKKKEKVITRPPKVIVNSNTLVSIDEGLLQGFSGYSLKVYHNAIEKLTFRIPENIEILDVSSPQNIVNKGSHRVDGNTLTVYLNSRVRDGVNLNIAYEKTFENKKTELDIPDIFPIGEEIGKVSGYVAVQSSGNSEIKTIKTNNISRIDISDLPKSLSSLAEYPIVSAYSFLKSDFSLSLALTPHKDAPVQVAMADKMRADSRLAHNGIMTSKVDYTVRNMSEQFFRFNLPENAEILSAAINGIPQQVEKQEDKEAKDTVYLINIKKYQDTNPFNLTVMYRQKLRLNKLLTLIDLELPRVVNMPVLTISWSVYAPKGLSYWKFTELNKGDNNYLRYIPQNYLNKREGIFGERARTQAARNYEGGEQGLEAGKVRGVLPPEFTMPPVKGLKKYSFSGYLTGSETVNVSLFGFTVLVYYPVLFLAGYFAWKKRAYLADKFKKIVQR